MFIALLEFIGIVFGLIVLLLLVTQVVVPVIMGTPFFPLFRKSKHAAKVGAAATKLEETTELVLLNKRLAEINREQEELEAQAAALKRK